MLMRKGIIIAVMFMVILWVQPHSSVSAQSNNPNVDLYYAEPDDVLDIRMQLPTTNLEGEDQTFTGLPVNVTITDPHGNRIWLEVNGESVQSFNHTVTQVRRVWFGWQIPHDSPLGNHTIFVYDYDTFLNATTIVIVHIPYIIVITGFVSNSYGSTYPSYPITFINFNRTEFAEGVTDQDGFYSVVLTNTTIGDTLYGIAKMVAEESSVTLTVMGNFTQSFHTQQIAVAGGNQGGGSGSGSGRVNSLAQRDSLFYGAIAMAFVSLGTASAVMVKMAKK